MNEVWGTMISSNTVNTGQAREGLPKTLTLQTKEKGIVSR